MTLPTNDINNLLNQVMAEMAGVTFSARNPKTGNPIKFNLPKGAKLYRYFRGADTNDYCYTPHADVDGYYYSWAYMGIGIGSRSGRAKTWKLKYLRTHRKRKDAKARAIRMYKATKKEST